MRGDQPTMVSHGVEISIAGGVGDKIYAQIPSLFLFSYIMH